MNKEEIENKIEEIRVDDLKATKRLMEVFISINADEFNKIVFEYVLKKVTQVLSDVESGELKTTEVKETKE